MNVCLLILWDVIGNVGFTILTHTILFSLFVFVFMFVFMCLFFPAKNFIWSCHAIHTDTATAIVVDRTFKKNIFFALCF